CPDGETKRAWYDAQQRLRNQVERTYDVRMGFTLGQLKAAAPGSGQDDAPETDVMAALSASLRGTLVDGGPAAPDEPVRAVSTAP
ncbi:MAG: hypothetical protein RH982_01195, partial [Parvibaculum sp.]